jgi:ornithine cyclodeaminase/alanine dehydrogenase-like protein (mu-crystallin family)
MDAQALLKEKRILYLSQNDLITAGLLDTKSIVADVRQGLLLHAHGETINEKLALDIDVNKDWKISALVGITGAYAGVKWLGANVDNLTLGLPRSHSIIAINDRVTGRILCIMDGAMISALRTGAYAALATEVLASQSPNTVGIIGAGVIARSVLTCMEGVVPNQIDRVLVNDIRLEYAVNYAELMGEKTGFEIEVLEDPRELTRRSDITVSATTTMEPFMKFKDIRPGSTHIHLGGWEDELDYVVACAQPPNKILCDDIDLVIHRNVQTVAFAFHDGLIRLGDFHGTLGEVLLGEIVGREGDELIYFNAVGLPVLDVCVGSRLFETALERKIGTTLNKETPHWILTGK